MINLQVDTKEKIQELDNLGVMLMLPREPNALLLLDEDSDRSRQIQSQLKDSSVNVYTASNVEEAKLLAHTADVVVGFVSPDISGEQILDVARNIGNEPVIVSKTKRERLARIGSALLRDNGNIQELATRIKEVAGISPMHDVGIFNETSGLRLYKGDGRISSSDVFDIMYSGLQQAIELNKLERKKMARLNYASRKSQISTAMEEWKHQIPYDIVALLETPYGYYKFNVQPRTNMDELMIKLPSIVYLGRGHNHLILRAARTYPPEEAWYESGKLGSDSDRKYYEAIYKGQHQKIRPDLNRYMLVPEPYLLATLQQLYGEGGPRIAPSIKVTEIDDGDVYYIRPWLKLQRDLPLNYRAAAEHIAALHGYGLFEVGERRPQHYAYEDDEMVNLDPDYIFHCGRRCGALDTDMANFYSEIRRDHPLFSLFLKRTVKAGFKEPYWAARKSFESQNYRQRFLDAVPYKLEDSALSDIRV